MSLNLAVLLRDATHRQPDAPAVFAGSRRLDYATVHARSQRFATIPVFR